MFKTKKNKTMPWVVGSTVGAAAIGVVTYAMKKQKTVEKYESLDSGSNGYTNDYAPEQQHGEYQLTETDQKHIEELERNLLNN